jgi:hypothetical protein
MIVESSVPQAQCMRNVAEAFFGTPLVEASSLARRQLAEATNERRVRPLLGKRDDRPGRGLTSMSFPLHKRSHVCEGELQNDEHICRR